MRVTKHTQIGQNGSRGSVEIQGTPQVGANSTDTHVTGCHRERSPPLSLTSPCGAHAFASGLHPLRALIIAPEGPWARTRLPLAQLPSQSCHPVPRRTEAPGWEHGKSTWATMPALPNAPQ